MTRAQITIGKNVFIFIEIFVFFIYISSSLLHFYSAGFYTAVSPPLSPPVVAPPPPPPEYAFIDAVRSNAWVVDECQEALIESLGEKRITLGTCDRFSMHHPINLENSDLFVFGSLFEGSVQHSIEIRHPNFKSNHDNPSSTTLRSTHTSLRFDLSYLILNSCNVDDSSTCEPSNAVWCGNVDCSQTADWSEIRFMTSTSDIKLKITVTSPTATIQDITARKYRISR